MEESKITRAKANGALNTAAVIIKGRIQDEPAAEVRRVARLLLPDFGFQVPHTKSEITELVTDFSKVNPLTVLRAFAIGLRPETLASIKADVDGRVVEPTLFREGPPLPPDPGHPRSFYAPQ